MNSALFVTWNIERQAPDRRRARTMIDRIMSLSPDVICLTEAFEGSTRDLGGFEISVRGVCWSSEAALERKVVLWSRMPWADIDLIGNEPLRCGGFIAATTRTPLGAIRVVGVCVPHHFASPIDVVPKPRLWSQQILYLSGLKPVVTSRSQNVPMVVLGDFNQYVPRIWGSKAASYALADALGDLSICTGSLIGGVNKVTIDHVALSSGLKALSTHGIAEHDADGRKLSDHFGVAVTVGLGGGAKTSPPVA